MPATLEQLFAVRSQMAEDLLAYLQTLEEDLAKNPLLDRFGRTLDSLRIPLRVVPYEPVRDIEEVRAREHFRQTGASNNSDDPDKTARRVYASRGARFDDGESSNSRPER